jgi:protein-L-isoaspartate O-methyltransferase
MQCQVLSVEIVPELVRAERERLAALGFERVTVAAGDVMQVLDPQDSFHAILSAAAPASVPPRLIEHCSQ